MKLYIFNGSPNARKALAAAYYLPLDVDVEWMDVTCGDLTRESFLEINPNGKVPALKDGEWSVWESNAILVYLAVKSGGKLFPDDPRGRANVLSWLFWETNHFNRAIGMLTWERVLRPAFGLGKPDNRQVEIGEAMFLKTAPVLENALQAAPYVVGDKLTIADFALGAFASFIDIADVPMQSFPGIRDWFGRLESVAAWRESAPDLTLLGRGEVSRDVA